MITRKELTDALEEIDTKRITIKDRIQAEIIDVFEKRGLVEHEPTAKEKYERTKKFSGFVFKNIPGEWFSIEVVNDILRLADAAIAEAEEGARK